MGARTGARYLAQLREEGPEIWIGSERLQDVTAHPATRGAAAEFARLYDLQFDDRARDVALFPSPTTGDLVGTQFLLPRSREDWERRRGLHKLWADASYGVMGRTTDFMSAMVAGWYVSADHFGEYAGNVRAYFEHIRENDLFLTHTLLDPAVDRSQPPSRQPDPFTCLGAVRETDRGLIVRGAKMLATACPFADELLVWSFSVLISRYGPDDEKYVLGFAIPCNSPGLRFISREPYGVGKNRFDHPLSSRFDELDGVAVFDDVLVPWERVFIYQDIEKVSKMYQTAMAAFSAHQTGIRFWAKLELLAGLARAGSKMLKTDQNTHVQDLIAEITTYLELTRAAIIAAEAEARPNEEGYYITEKRPLFALRSSANRWYPRVKENLQLIFSGSLMYLPASYDAFTSPVGDDVRRYYRSADATAEERVKLLKIISDYAVSGFGGRQELYERFYSGDPYLLRIAQQFIAYDWSAPLAAVDRLLAETNLNDLIGSAD